MSDKEFSKFLEVHGFVACPRHSLPEEGMASRVDAFVNENVLLRLVVDRGQRFIELARLGTDKWIDIFTLASSVDNSFRVRTGSFTEATQVLSKYWPQFVLRLRDKH